MRKRNIRNLTNMLKVTTAFVGLYTGDGAAFPIPRGYQYGSAHPQDGDPDPEAIAREAKELLSLEAESGDVQPVNLDGLNESELRDYAETFEALAKYASKKEFAMFCRKAGSIDKAAKLEAECERIYSRLPHPWKW